MRDYVKRYWIALRIVPILSRRAQNLIDSNELWKNVRRKKDKGSRGRLWLSPRPPLRPKAPKSGAGASLQSGTEPVSVFNHETSYKGWAKINCRGGPIQLAKATGVSWSQESALRTVQPGPCDRIPRTNFIRQSTMHVITWNVNGGRMGKCLDGIHDLARTFCYSKRLV